MSDPATSSQQAPSWHRIRRRAAADSFHHRRLALGVFGSDASRWPRRNRLPRTLLARGGHFLAGLVLGAVFAAIMAAWISAGCPS